MPLLQENMFPDRALPTIIWVVPSYIERWKRDRSPKIRQEAHYLDTLAEQVFQRVTSWSSPKDLLETPHFVYQFFGFWNALETYKMPTKKQASTEFKKQEWKGFVERVLSDDELIQCDDWHMKPAEAIEAMCSLSEAGYDLKLSYNQHTKTGNATLVDNRTKLPTSGYALSARGTNCADALKLLIYKHYQLLAQNWDELLSTPPKSRRG